MEVILTKDVETLGARNEVVRVKDGYARNYLLPQHLAIVANKGNLALRSKKIDEASKAREERISAAQGVADKLHNKSFVILAKAGKEGKLFGSVTGQDIVGCIFAFTGIEVDKRMINLTSTIKDLGVYQVNMRADEAESVEEIEAIEEATAEYVEAQGEEQPPELLPEPGQNEADEG